MTNLSPELSLSDRMAALSAKLKAEDPETRSSLRTPSPLSLILAIYSKAEHECYIDYMQGAKDLISWLGPIEIPDREPITSGNTSRLLRGYEIQQLSKILAGPTKITDQAYITKVNNINHAIIRELVASYE